MARYDKHTNARNPEPLAPDVMATPARGSTDEQYRHQARKITGNPLTITEFLEQVDRDNLDLYAAEPIDPALSSS